MNTAERFLEFALSSGVLKFGQFKIKSGRLSPYFFNTGLFDDGAKLDRLAGFYADCLLEAKLEFDTIFGPAYKGIPLAAVLATELARRGISRPVCFNRKEAKDHGEGGVLIGAPLRGRVLVVDDVISAGTAVGESVRLIRSQGAEIAGVLISLDRQEKAGTAEAPLAHSAVQYVEQEYGVKVYAVARLDNLLSYLEHSDSIKAHRAAVQAYRAQYGVDAQLADSR